MRRRIAKLCMVGLFAVGLGACSSSKSAEKDDEETTAKQQAQKEGENTGESTSDEASKQADESANSHKQKMHKLHKSLVKTYLDNRETYKQRAEEGSEMIKETYTLLMKRHDPMAEKYKKHMDGEGKGKKKGHKKEKAKKKGHSKGKKKGHKKEKGKKKGHGKKPKYKHVAKMAEKLDRTGDAHKTAAKLEADADNQKLHDHHADMADSYMRLAKMHEEMARQMKEKHADKKKGKKSERKKGKKGKRDKTGKSGNE